MKLQGNAKGHRLGRQEPRRVIAQVLRSNATADYSDGVWPWCNMVADEILEALAANGTPPT